MSGWIGVDLDGTLAHYSGWVDEGHIGEPIPAMAQYLDLKERGRIAWRNAFRAFGYYEEPKP